MWEYQIFHETKYNSQLIGFVDLAFEIQYEGSYERNFVYFEIKTAIPSLGELIRQLNTYRTYLREYKNIIVVVSPDDTHKTILEEQNYHLYKYKDPEKLF